MNVINEKPLLVFDIECYVNYFLIVGRTHPDQEVIIDMTMFNNVILGCPTTRQDLSFLIGEYTLVSFNGNKYDMLILTAFLNGANNYELKMLSDKIIKHRLMPWQFEREYQCQIPRHVDHIDLFELPKGVYSLKMYGARLGTQKLQELPIHHNSLITPMQVTLLHEYCHNDITVTSELYDAVSSQLELRRKMSEQFGTDLRSKSDAQIGETTIVLAAERLLGQKLTKPNVNTMCREFKYTPPPYIQFQGEQLNDWLTMIRGLTFKLSAKHKLVLHKDVSKVITIGGKGYKFGIGGLHSTDDRGTYYADDEYELLQIDAGSFYPNTILNAGFYPPQIGAEVFDKVYRGFVNQRNNAKVDLENLRATLEEHQSSMPVDDAKADLMTIIGTVKIILNGFYGKLGSHYSKAFAPGMLLHVTLTGQLALCMMLEQLEAAQIQVLSANTDGITVRVKRTMRQHLDDLVKWWGDVTGYEMGYDHYNALFYRDVNNYFCHYTDDKIKGIGIFNTPSLGLSPSFDIIRQAVFAVVRDGTPIRDTVYSCDDIQDFITVAKVTGGATKDGELIGGIVRWYRSTATDTPIMYAKLVKGGKKLKKVAVSDNGMPCMDFPYMNAAPDDVDREWYVSEATALCELLSIKT